MSQEGPALWAFQWDGGGRPGAGRQQRDRWRHRIRHGSHQRRSVRSFGMASGLDRTRRERLPCAHATTEGANFGWGALRLAQFGAVLSQNRDSDLPTCQTGSAGPVRAGRAQGKTFPRRERHSGHERKGAAAWPPGKGEESRMKVHMQKVSRTDLLCLKVFAMHPLGGSLLPRWGTYPFLDHPRDAFCCSDNGLALSGSAGRLGLDTAFLTIIFSCWERRSGENPVASSSPPPPPHWMGSRGM